MKTHPPKATFAIAVALLATTAISRAAEFRATTTAAATACPFCVSIKQTLAEQMIDSDVSVLAKLITLPDLENLEESDELPKGTFEVVDVISGERHIAKDFRFQAICVGQHEAGDVFLVMGSDAPAMIWTTPLKMSKRGIAYIKKVPSLPEKGPKRLAFFQDYLEDEEAMLAFDAYDEFAQAPYEDIIGLKEVLHREKFLKWVQDPEVSTNRKRLYFTLLGICGQKEDIALLEELIRSDEREKRKALDALIACYLNLKGKDGLALVTERFLKNQDAEYIDTFAAITALRFHGTEIEIIPATRLWLPCGTCWIAPKWPTWSSPIWRVGKTGRS